ncbi:MAG: hypothetical protein ACRD2O_08455 [Terriglobia bacterium]
MKKWLLVAATVLIAGAVVGAWQQPSGKLRGETWEYCQVQSWEGREKNEPVPAGTQFRYTYVGKASICYDEATGCRTETVTAPYSSIHPKNFIEDPDIGRSQQEAVASALAKLGAEGWRMVGAGPDPSAVRPNGQSASSPVRSILYFERPKL